MKHNYIIKVVGDNGELLTASELIGVDSGSLQTYLENKYSWIPPFADSGDITVTYSVDPWLWEELRIKIAPHVVTLRNIAKLKKRKKQRLKRRMIWKSLK